MSRANPTKCRSMDGVTAVLTCQNRQIPDYVDGQGSHLTMQSSHGLRWWLLSQTEEPPPAGP